MDYHLVQIKTTSSIWDPTTQHNGFLAPHAEAQCEEEGGPAKHGMEGGKGGQQGEDGRQEGQKRIRGGEEGLPQED